MEIQINDCPVDFDLTGEKTIIDVINSISEWTHQRNLIFAEAEINNKNYSLDQIPSISLDDIVTLNCLLQSKSDVVISSLDAGIDYCVRIQNFIEKSIVEKRIDSAEVENIITGIDWIVEAAGKISDLLDLDLNEIKYKDNFAAFYIDRIIEFKKNIKKIKDNPDQLIEFINKEKEIFPVISGILKMLLMSENMRSLVIQSIDSPDTLIKSLLSMKEEIPAQIKNLEEIAVSYQRGKDDIASKKLELFIDFMFNYTRTCYQIAPVFEIDLENIAVGGLSLNEKNSRMQDLLHEITGVLENNDIISLSDILEYEMKSSLEDLEVYIDFLIGHLKETI